MATYKLTPDDSIIAYGAFDGYFLTGTSSADTLTVDAGTLIYLLGTGADAGVALELDNRAPWTATINGSLWSEEAVGLFLDPGVTGTKPSMITIGTEGSIYGGAAGIAVGGYNANGPYANAPVTIINNGDVAANMADGIGIYFNTTGAHIITNSGNIFGFFGVLSEAGAADTVTNTGQMSWIALGDGTNKLVNSNWVEGYSGGSGGDTVENNGIGASIDLGVYLGDGTNSLKNSGVINYYGTEAGVIGLSGADTVSNSADIYGGIDLGGGTNKVTNTGWIGLIPGGDLSYAGGGGADSITNTASAAFFATLEGGVELGAGVNSVTNSGYIGESDGVSINAGVDADSVTNSAGGELAGAVILSGGANKLTNAGNVGVNGANASYVGEGGGDTVGNTGWIKGNVLLGDGSNALTNSKWIDGDVLGGIGSDSVTNSAAAAEILGNVDLGGGTNKVSNSGRIASIVASGATGTDTVTNEASGVIEAAVNLGGTTVLNAVDTLTNKGVVEATAGVSYIGADTGDSVTNSGTLKGRVVLGNGTNVLSNTGAIGQNNLVAVLGGADKDTVTSSKAILGGINLGEGANALTNSGAVGADENGVSYQGGSGVDTVVNSGTIIGAVHMGGGDDIFTNFSGKVHGTALDFIDMGTGNDKFVGGNNAELVVDNDGSDNYALGAGNDQFSAVGAIVDATDTVDGGAGTDFYVADDATMAVRINLGTAAVTDTFSSTNVAALSATGSEIGADSVKAFENAVGGAGNDILIGSDGSSAANLLIGGDGDDDLLGLGGNDTLFGDQGSDHLLGGVGRDILFGGDGSGPDGDIDYFVFNSAADSGVARAARDLIVDFELGTDQIVLRGIDANTTAGHVGDDGFTFIGTNVVFSHTAGELRAYWTVNGQIVEGDVNGDGRADFSVELQGLAPSDVLSASDFIL